MKAPRGRRQGASTSRNLIVASARGLFAEHGYAATSLREIARVAGVDPALVHHYFASKEELFNACVKLPLDPAQVLAVVGATPPQERGEQIIRTLLELWDSPAQPALLTLLRNATGSHGHNALIREVFLTRILAKTTTGLPGDAQEVALRGSLMASQVFGVMFARYILRLEPLASASHDEVTALVAPTVQRYLTGPLGS